MDLARIKNHIALTSCNEVKQICDGLQKYGIVDFIYLEIDTKNNTMIDLSTNHAWSEYYLDNYYKLKYEKDLVLKHTLCLEDTMTNLWALEPDNKMWREASEYFNVGNGITIEEKNTRSAFKEIFYFVSTPHNNAINNFYLNNLDILKKFTFLFKDKAEKLIHQYESDRLPIPKEYLPPPKKNPFSDQDAQDHFFTERHFISRDLYLTKREIECVSWVVKGKSSAEMSEILGISKRTVECHLDNVKKKLGYYKLPSLIHALTKQGLL
jgi:LuxR family quorum-sensing system transcriptional regulator SolR